MKVTHGGSPVVTAVVAVSDPRWLQSLRLPRNGRLTAAGSCGMDSSGPHAKRQHLDHINSLIPTAWAVRDDLAGYELPGIPE